MQSIDFDTRAVFIGGHWQPASFGRTMPLLNPSDGSELTQIARGSPAEIDAAVHAARESLAGPWGQMSAAERGRILLRMSARVSELADVLARMEALDVGKPVKQGLADANALARYLEFYGGAADKVMGETIPFTNGYTALTLREPHGVTGHIVPWNYPMQIIGRSVGAALAMGNACVLKPAEEACLTALAFARIGHDCGLPAGALNVVPGLGEEAGAALARHHGVQHLSFTGSVAVGQLVQAAAAKNTIPVTLELGGKSPQIVFADADLDAALPFLVNAGIQNAGQTCSAASRILVEASVFDGVVSRMAEHYKKLVVGPAINDPDVGPLISERQREQVQGYLHVARDSGLRVAAQAELRGDLPRPPAGAGRNLRPGTGGDGIRRRGRRDRAGQRHTVRTGGRRVDPRRQPGAARGTQAAMRPGVRQQLRRRRRRGVAVRRRQAIGARAREGLRGAVRFLDAEDHRDQTRLRRCG
jgi:aldehyde dehydrogenase (NAD+)